MNTDVLVESKSLRDEYVGRTDVLDKVRKLVFLPDDLHATVEMVTTYYEVGFEAIKSIIKENREELESDGLSTLSGEELRSLKDLGCISKNTAALIVIPRRAILRVGMLLRDSVVAKEVRTALLNIEEAAREQAPQAVKEALAKQEREARLQVMLMNAQTRRAKLIFDTTKEFKERLSDTAIESLVSVATEMLAGKEILPRPQTEKLYSATEIGQELGVSANRIGRLAERHGLKTVEYGVFVLDKSPYSAKQVSSFRYNEKGRETLRELLQAEGKRVGHAPDGSVVSPGQ